MNNKKGISAIVATVLIILITVAAVTIIWAAIIPMIQNNIQGSQECFDASAALSVTTDFSCVAHTVGVCSVPTGNCGDNETICEATGCGGTWTGAKGTVDVQVHRSTGDFTLTGVEIIIGAAGNTESEIFPINATYQLDVNGDKVYTVSYDGAKVTEAGVAAIVQAGNTEKACDKSGMVQIPDCVA